MALLFGVRRFLSSQRGDYATTGVVVLHMQRGDYATTGVVALHMHFETQGDEVEVPRRKAGLTPAAQYLYVGHREP